MYLVFALPEGFIDVYNSSKESVSRILQEITPLRSSHTIPSDRKIIPQENDDKLRRLVNGHVKASVADKVVLVYEEGDIIGLEGLSGLHHCDYLSEFAVIVDEYDWQEVRTAIRESKELFDEWNHYLSCHIVMREMMAASLMQDVSKSNPNIYNFEAGDTIIKEGDEGSEVYTMIDGLAHVFVDGVKVGEIMSNEIFGAIAALTNVPRTATVKAEGPCTVMGATKESFSSLIRSHPDTMVKLIEDLTRVIISTNKKIVDLSS